MAGLLHATKLAFSLVCLLLTSACESWLQSKLEKKLPGARIEVLGTSKALSADKRAANLRVILPEPKLNIGWPQAGGYPNHAMHHLAAPGPLSVQWSTSIGDGTDEDAQLLSEPIFWKNRVYTMDINAVVSSLDAITGKKIWQVKLSKNNGDEGILGGGLAIEDNRLYATTGFAEVVSLELESGREIWRKRLNGPIRAPPTVSEGRLFAVTIANQIFALSISDGRELWTHAGLGEIAGLVGGAAPAVDRGIVIVPYSSGEVVALRVDNGGQVWTESLVALRRVDSISAISHVRGKPVIDRGIVFVVGNGNRTVAIDLRTGTRLWEIQIGGKNGPWVAGEFVYVLTRNAKLVCITRGTGMIKWIAPLPQFKNQKKKKNPIFWSGPVLAGDRLLAVGTQEEIWSISPYSGKILGRKKIGDAISISPIVARETVYVLTDNADLIALR